MSAKKQEDTLKQLEKLLADDAKYNGDDKKNSTISKREITGITIRISVSLVLILILYFTGVFDRPIFVSLAILFILSIEITRYINGRKAKTRGFD